MGKAQTTAAEAPAEALTPGDLGSTFGGEILTTTERLTTSRAEAAREQHGLLALVAKDADEYVERLALAIESHIGGMNGALRHPAVRVLRGAWAPGGLILHAIDPDRSFFVIGKDFLPNDQQPGVRTFETRRGCRYQRPHRFVNGGPDGLQLRVDGLEMGPEDAAHALLKAWLDTLDLLAVQNRWSQERERLVLRTIAPLRKADGLSITELTDGSPVADFDAVDAIDSDAFSPGNWTLAMFRAVLRQGCRVFVSLSGPRSTGYVLIGRVENGVLPIARLAVASADRRQGIGSALVAHALNQGVKHSATRASVDIPSDSALIRQFYSRAGFEAAAE